MVTKGFTYTLVYEQDSKSGLICASFPALDLSTYGRTVEEARARAREALELHLEGLVEETIPIPPDVMATEHITVDVPIPAQKAITASERKIATQA